MERTNILVIESQQNKTFQGFLDLLNGGSIAKGGLALLSGQKAIEDTLNLYPQYVQSLIISSDDQLGNLRLHAKTPIYHLKKNLFEKLNQIGTPGPLLVIRVPEFKKIDEKTLLKGQFLFVPFQDPGNVGGVLRSAAAFGFRKIILAPGSAHPFHPRSSRAASGTLFEHDYFQLSDLEILAKLPIAKLGLDMSGKPYNEFEYPENFILIPGIEGSGLKNFNLLTEKINIPISSTVESLNAMVATSVVLAHIRSQNHQ